VLLTTDQDRVNRRVYHAARVPYVYRETALDAAETMALLAYQGAFAGRSVLDLGVGTGRTTRFVRPLAARYVAIDFSPPMVDALRTRMPGVDVRLGDMRDLSPFADASFDFVLGSCNVIDAVGHEDRLRVFAEVGRVLSPGGVFAFSSHNRRFHEAPRGPILRYARNPVTQALHVLRYLRSHVTHARMKRFRRDERDYAILNDPGHDYALLHYYIDREHQRAQLATAGFEGLDEFDLQGRRLSAGDEDRGTSSVFYVARYRKSCTTT
jgi:SAM-dependent methyltransferase